MNQVPHQIRWCALNYVHNHDCEWICLTALRGLGSAKCHITLKEKTRFTKFLRGGGRLVVRPLLVKRTTHG